MTLDPDDARAIARSQAGLIRLRAQCALAVCPGFGLTAFAVRGMPRTLAGQPVRRMRRTPVPGYLLVPFHDSGSTARSRAIDGPPTFSGSASSAALFTQIGRAS